MPNVMLWAQDDVTGKPVVVKSHSNAIATVTTEHQQVHDGKHYTVSYLNAALAAAANLDILFITGANFELNFVPTVGVGGSSVLYIYEGTTVSANGTALTAVNNKYSSTNTAEGTFFHTPTVTGVGTQKFITFIPGGSGVFSGGGSGGGPIRGGTENIMKVSTNYMFRLTNVSAGAIYASIGIGFYEH